MIKRTICVICDGLGDRPIADFGGKTPLEAANTPNLDRIVQKSQCGLMHTMGRGIRPGSDVSHLAIFGYPMDKYYTGRGPIEVAGIGIELLDGDVAFRGNFGTVDEDWNILDRRAGRIRVVNEFTAAIDGIEIDGVKCIVTPGTAHRAGVVFRGKGLSAAISDADPHEMGKPVMEVKPLDDSAEAAFTAQVINKFMRQSYEILNEMEANKKRSTNGEFPANFLLLRGAGFYKAMPKFEEQYGLKACCIAGGGLYKGIGAFLGMDVIPLEGTTGLYDTNVEIKIKTALELLENDYEFAFVHIKAADSLGEDGNPEGKRDFIEKIDKAMALLTDLPDDTLMIFTADHSTPCELMGHSADPVPIFYSNPSARIDEVSEIGERAFAKGGLGFMEGKDVMPNMMNLMGKLHLIGA